MAQLPLFSLCIAPVSPHRMRRPYKNAFACTEGHFAHAERDDFADGAGCPRSCSIASRRRIERTDDDAAMEGPERDAVGDLLSPLRYRDFRLAVVAQVASELGDWAGRLALVGRRGRTDPLRGAHRARHDRQRHPVHRHRPAARDVRQPLHTASSTIVVTDLGRALIFVLPRHSDAVAAAVRARVPRRVPDAAVRGRTQCADSAHRSDASDSATPVALASITFDLAVLGGYAAGGALLCDRGPAYRAAGQRRLVRRLRRTAVIASAVARSPSNEAERSASGTAGARWSTIRSFVASSCHFTVDRRVRGRRRVAGRRLRARACSWSRRVSAGLLAAAIPVGAIVAVLVASTQAAAPTPSSCGGPRSSRMVGALIGMLMFAPAPGLPLILLGFAAVGALNASRVPGQRGRRAQTRGSVARSRDLGDRQRLPARTAGIRGRRRRCCSRRSFGVRPTIVVALVHRRAVIGAWGASRPPHELRHAAPIAS